MSSEILTKEQLKEWQRSPHNIANRETNGIGCARLIGKFFANMATIKPIVKIIINNRNVTSKELSKKACRDNINFLLSKRGEKVLQSYCDVVEQDFEKIKDGIIKINKEWLVSYN